MNLTLMRQIATIQCYIHHLKGVEVDIKIPETMREKQLLKIALNSANQYLK